MLFDHLLGFFSFLPSCSDLLSYSLLWFYYFISSLVFHLTLVSVIYLLESSQGLECSHLLIRGHFLEAGAWRGPRQGVFLSHIPDVLLQLTKGDYCLLWQEKKKKTIGEVFNISQQTTALNLQSSADRHKTMASISFASQANISLDIPG